MKGFEHVADIGLTSHVAKHVRPIHRMICESGRVPIHSSVIENALDIRGTAVRSAVSFLRTLGYPIASDERGYWIATTRAELQGTLDHISSRASKLRAVLDGLAGAWNKLPAL